MHAAVPLVVVLKPAATCICSWFTRGVLQLVERTLGLEFCELLSPVACEAAILLSTHSLGWSLTHMHLCEAFSSRANPLSVLRQQKFPPCP